MSFLPSDLHVIAVVSNPVRYESRYQLYRKFKEKILAQGVKLWTVEAAFGHRAFSITEACDPQALQLRAVSELWHKENMINLMIEKLSREAPNWKYVCWCDADVEFMDPNWAVETVHALQHYAIVQPWQTAVDLGPDGEALQIHQSFGWCVVNGKAVSVNWRPYITYPHTGFAWAARREVLDGMGQLYERAILGSGDHHMAWSLIGKGRQTLPGNSDLAYNNDILAWESRAANAIKRNVGFVPGNIHHHWHGKKKDRKYVDRWKILLKYNYNPVTDVYRDTQGLLRLNDDGSERMIGMRDDIRSYFRQRNEDSIDAE